jgi:hypothetical protein
VRSGRSEEVITMTADEKSTTGVADEWGHHPPEGQGESTSGVIVLVDPRRPSLVPVDAIDLLTGDVQYTEEMPVKVPWSLPAARP